MKKRRVIITYWRGKKSFNSMLRTFDLGVEGAFVKDTASGIPEKGLRPSRAWKTKIENALRDAWGQQGFEIKGIEFKMETEL